MTGGTVLPIALTAVLVYHVVIRGTAAKLATLIILVVAVIIGSPMDSGLPVDEYRPMLFMTIDGAKSPYALVAIRAILAELLLEARKAGH
ncbi:hypothetical protein ACFRAU_07475 [Arthrobacter sp. NPDC056691]|uniref:hypothetical protein n=1 Tax=Arthrobacter sp. NPDC056691 TaxID=3345913 RepID=UPI00366D97B1